MFTKKPLTSYAGLTKEIEKLVSELEGTTPGSNEYNTIVESLVKLDGINHSIVKATSLSKDAILAATVSIIGILLVINTEATGAITTKAFSMLKK